MERFMNNRSLKHLMTLFAIPFPKLPPQLG